MPFEFEKFEPYFDGNNDISELVSRDDETSFLPFEFEQLETKKNKVKEIPNEAKQLQNKKGTDLLKIVAYPTNKHKIEQRPLMKADVIPRHASSVIFNGKSGSGKSNLMINLLTRPEFYGPKKAGEKGYFDMIFLFSPTANGGDDLVTFLNLPEKRIDTSLDTKKLDHIINTQQKLIEQKGIMQSPKILIIFDDCQSDANFLKTKSFMRCFIQCRHLNISTFLCGQRFNRTPKACRMQANNIFFFPGSDSEVELMTDEYTPPNTSKKAFRELIQHATTKPYDFLHINLRSPVEKRFRHNLDQYLKINRK